jgi:hypothetical protein
MVMITGHVLFLLIISANGFIRSVLSVNLAFLGSSAKSLMCTRWVISQSFDESVWNNSIGGGDDVHGLTKAFQGSCALPTDTPPPMAITNLCSVTPQPLGHSPCKQSTN